MTRFAILCVAALGLLGCDDDTLYFCTADGPPADRGCFLCRGDDCQPQAPPTRSICMDAVDCAVGEVCTNLGCTRECTEEFDCGIGTTCIDNLCRNPIEPTPVIVTSEDPAPSPAPDPPTGQCQFNFECGDSRVCVDGQCLFTCIDEPCPGTQQCRDGACRPCMDQTCLTNCSDDVECEAHEYCSDFQCMPDTRPQTFCPENDCQPGRVCRNGQCRTPCDTNDECARIDATIRFCASVGSENLCVRSVEVLAECQLNIDCGLGDECADGACVTTSGSP
ncbi:MAG: hypothetical protein WBG86_23315 [Polyangiales bacterium]